MSTVRIPNVGSEVELTMKNSFGAAMIPPQPTEYVISGKVLNPHRWLNDREFCLTGSPDWPVRVIHIDRVIKMRMITGKARAVDTSLQTWEVAGSKPGSKYTVTRSNRGWNCSCTGFGFRKTCKHVVELGQKNK